MTTAGGSPGRADAQAIYGQLRAEIGGGVLPPGSPVREVALATRFGVSRTPVREALRRLQHDRLLVPGARGLQVRAVDPQEVVQVYDVRILLEAEAASQAARSRGVADLLRLEGLLARDRGLDEPDDAVRASTNMEFHAAVWQAAHNAVLEDLLHRLTIHLVHAPRSTLSVPGRWEEALDEHARLIEAIAAGDEATARQVAGGHMHTAREIRLSLLRDAASDRADLARFRR
jgi:DNA-binding GntR family transcriptional regulator